jgi:hypothetical protein
MSTPAGRELPATTERLHRESARVERATRASPDVAVSDTDTWRAAALRVTSRGPD